jgi:glutathione S-transferase
MLRLYDYLPSGNGYKVRLLLCQLGLDFERVEIDIVRGETRTAAFLALNPNHRIPMVQWPDGRRLTESNAIIFHLAEATPYLPDDPWGRAQVLEWLFFEQYDHEPNIAVARSWHIKKVLHEHRDELPARLERGYHALNVMEQHLAESPFFVGRRYTVADIALYAYTHVAGEGGFDLSGYPRVRAWLERVAAQPGHVGITAAVGRPVAWP